MIKDNHIIQKLIFEFDIDTSLNLSPFKSGMFDSISSERVFSAVDSCFCDFSKNSQNLPIEIEKLEIDLGTLVFEEIDNITEKIRSTLEKELKEIDISENSENIIIKREEDTQSIQFDSNKALKKRVSLREKIDLNSGIIIFKHYLKYGILPWWVQPDNINLNEIADFLIEEANDIFPDILKKELSDERVLRRTIYTFKDEQLLIFLKKISPEKEKYLNYIASDMKTLKTNIAQNIWNTLREKMWNSFFTRKEEVIIQSFIGLADKKEMKELFSAIEKLKTSNKFKTKLPEILKDEIQNRKKTEASSVHMPEKTAPKPEKEIKNSDPSAFSLSEIVKKALSDESYLISLIDESSDEELIKLYRSENKGKIKDIDLYREVYMVLSGIRILRNTDRKLLRTIVWESIFKTEESSLLTGIIDELSERLIIEKEDIYDEFFRGLINLKRAGYRILSDYASMIDTSCYKIAREILKEVKPGNYKNVLNAENKEIVKTEDIINEVKFPFSIEDDIYVTNAGIILLWPYLPGFFGKLKLTENNQFISGDCRMKAISLINYISFGVSGIEEFHSPLSKILTGIDLDEPVDTNIIISDSDKEECETLLNAVIYNWGVLKNTSPDGLRNAFFQREGVIKMKSGSYLLYIEKKTHDILLDKLPWSINIVKLPWMQNLLFVEW